LDSIYFFNELFHNDYNNNNKTINEYIKINLDNLENKIKNGKSIDTCSMKLNLKKLKNNFKTIKIKFMLCKKIYVNYNCKNNVIKLVSGIEELLNKIDNYISYITEKEKEIKLNENEIIYYINNQFQ